MPGTLVAIVRWASHPRRCAGVAALGVIVFLAGAIVAPWLEAGPAAALRGAYHPLCHQSPARSLAFGGAAIALCARCVGLYLGGAIGLLLAGALGARTIRPAWLVLAGSPIALDVLARAAGFSGLSNAPRLATAVPAGIVAGWLLAAGLADWLGARPEPPGTTRMRATRFVPPRTLATRPRPGGG